MRLNLNKFYFAILIFIISSFGFFNLVNADSGSSSVFSDSVITSKVKTQLAMDKTTSATTISVKTINRVVYLSGHVGSGEEALQAVKIASSVSGVLDVDTRKLKIKNEYSPMTDSYITAKIKGAFVREKLFGDENIPVTQIKVETYSGSVYLRGEVEAQSQADQAIAIAKSIKGVRKVTSTIKVKTN